MRHITDGVLRRLDDEPLAVPDRVSDHVAGVGAAALGGRGIAQDTERGPAASGPQLVPDVDVAWARLQRELSETEESEPRARRSRRVVPRRRARFPRVSLRAGLVIGAVGIVVAGTAAAATLTTIFAPTHVAPVSLSQSDLRAIAAFTGLGDSHVLGGFSTPSGSSTLRFGTITWSPRAPPTRCPRSPRPPRTPAFRSSLPAHLPAGVGAVQRVHACSRA